MVDEVEYKKTVKKLKAIVQRIKLLIQEKNKEKITHYKKKKQMEQFDELSNLREEMGEFGKLNIFNNIPIQPGVRKPPVIGSQEITLSKD